MTPPTPSPITQEAARILAEWAGLPAADVAADLPAVFEAFRDRVQRLYAIDVETVEFDFLRPTE
ncbi:MAG TPA: hypothetical protein VMS64_39030 [Candidatus Methylomirabilis sp.]|nr:hypothetical protein [Candidatus Methylomirabilis sp.]